MDRRLNRDRRGTCLIRPPTPSPRMHRRTRSARQSRAAGRSGRQAQPAPEWGGEGLMAERHKGELVHWRTGSFGFLKPDAGGDDAFCLGSEMSHAGIDNPRVGMRFSWSLTEG